MHSIELLQKVTWIWFLFFMPSIAIALPSLVGIKLWMHFMITGVHSKLQECSKCQDQFAKCHVQVIMSNPINVALV